MNIEQLKRDAENGNATAQCALGKILLRIDYNGTEIDENADEGVSLLKNAAKQGNAEAAFNLGLCHLYGRGVAEDKTEAFKHTLSAAKKNYAPAQNNIGTFYENGIGVEKDINAAFEWYKKSADQGNAIGQLNVGNCYKDGIAVKRDFSEALKWIQLSAEQGNADAMFEIGRFYENGYGVGRDAKKSFNWYKPPKKITEKRCVTSAIAISTAKAWNAIFKKLLSGIRLLWNKNIFRLSPIWDIAISTAKA